MTPRGIGAFGKFLKSELQRHGVVTDYLQMDHRTNTTVIFVSSTATTPDFEEFRIGDFMLESKEVPEEAIHRARVVHSSTFALSREPCRSAVIEAFRRAQEMGKIVSLDPNYSRRVWPDYKEAQGVIREAYRHVNVTKPSADDARAIVNAARLVGAGGKPTYLLVCGARPRTASDPMRPSESCARHRYTKDRRAAFSPAPIPEASGTVL